MNKTWIIAIGIDYEGTWYYKFVGSFKDAEKAAYEKKREIYGDDYSVYDSEEWIKVLEELKL